MCWAKADGSDLSSMPDLEERRKRLREGVASVLLKEGWTPLENDVFPPPTG